MCGDDITYNPPAPVDYRDALQAGTDAQTDPEINRALYEAESNREYGRPAYARLDQEILDETLFGKLEEVDGDGFINKTTNVSAEGQTYIKDIDQAVDIVVERYGLDQLVQGWDNMANRDPAMWTQAYRTPDGGYDKLNIIKHWDKLHGGADTLKPEEMVGKALDQNGNLVEAEFVVERVNVGADKAGQTIRAGGGLVETLAGKQEHTFTDAEGNKVTRRIGYTEDGEPMGIAGVARDLQQVDTAQRFRTEIDMMEKYGDDFTRLYRKQGDIKGALDDVKKLAKESAIPSKQIDASVNKLANEVDALRNNRTKVGGPFNNQASNQPVQGPIPRMAEPGFGYPDGMTDTGNNSLLITGPENKDVVPGVDTSNDLLPSGAIDIDEKLGPEFGGMSRRELANFDNAMGVTREDYAGLTFEQAMGREPVPGQSNSQKIVQEANRVGRRIGYREPTSESTETPEMQGPNLTDGQAETALQNSDRNYQGPVRGSGRPGMENTRGGQRGSVASNAGVLGGPTKSVVPGEMPELDANGFPLDGYMLMDDGKYHYRIGGETLMVADTMQQLQESVAQMDTQPTMSGGDPNNLLNEIRIDKATANFGNQNLTDLRDQLSTDALAELKLGGKLSERDVRLAEQGARKAMTAMGRSRSTSAVLAELKNNEALREQRKASRRQFAGNVTQLEGGFATSEAELDLQAQFQNQGVQAGLVQLNQQAEMFNSSQDLAYDNMKYNALQQDESRRIQVEQINTQYAQSGLASDRAYASQRVGLEQATASDPLMAVTGRPSGAGVMSSDSVYGAGAGQTQTPQMFNPNIGAQFIADQASNLNDYNIAFGNQQAQVSAGKSQMFGNIVSSAFDLIPIPGGGKKTP